MSLQSRCSQPALAATILSNLQKTVRAAKTRCISFLLIGCSLSLTGCVPIIITMDQPTPYSQSLISLLNEPWADRAAVHSWLGEPPITRRQDQLEIYVAQEDVARSYPRLSDSANVYNYHYLLIEYTENNRIQHYEKFINAGCTTSGVCLFDRRCLGYFHCPDNVAVMYRGSQKTGFGGSEAEELLDERIGQVLVYATSEEDQQAKISEPESNMCMLVVDRPPALSTVKVTLPNEKSVQLPPDGFLKWQANPGEYSINIEWSDWKFEFDSQTASLSCKAGKTAYYHINLVQIKKWGWRYNMSIEEVLPSIGNEAINEKWLVLR